jgi:Fe2+ or Zn2+ uptake regulation protein
MIVTTQMQELLDDLLKHGMRVTAQRKYMLYLVLGYNRPFAAIELYHEMGQKFQGLSYGTVYQNLKLFSKLKMVESIAVANEIRYRVVEREQPKFHFICMDCENTVLIDCNIAQLSSLSPDSFKSVNYKLDVFGYCMECNLSGGQKQT